MKLIESLLCELGAGGMKNFTVVPAFGAYFCGVKQIAEFTAERIVLDLGKNSVITEGEGLSVAKYFEEDVFIKGEIKVIKIE